jgi:hypothetical protein
MVTASLALGLLLSRHPRWGFATMGLFGTMLSALPFVLPGGVGWHKQVISNLFALESYFFNAPERFRGRRGFCRIPMQIERRSQG